MSELYTFADFELDGRRFELRRAGCAVVIQPKVLRLLLLLVAERERAVSTEELFSALWPRERVGIGSVRRAVLGLRRALGEQGESQQSVRTVRGLGYQFVRPVRLATPRAQTPRPVPASMQGTNPTTLSAAETLPLYGYTPASMREQALKGRHSSDMVGRALSVTRT